MIALHNSANQIMIDKQTLQKKLGRLFESHIFRRGLRYYSDKNVESLKVFPGKNKNEIEIKGEVAGSDCYTAYLFFNLESKSFFNADCDCPYYDTCKHSAALGMEFIDLYVEFIQQNETQNLPELINWINNQDLAKNYSGNDSNNIDSDIYDNDGDQEIVEGEFEKLNSNNNDDILKKSLEEIGINTQGLSSDIINALQKNLKIQNNTEEPAYSTRPAIEQDINKKYSHDPKKFEADKFHLLIEYGYTFDIHLYKSGNTTIGFGKVLKKYTGFTESQKKLFEMLKNFHSDWRCREKIDIGELFSLIKDSEIAVFKRVESYYSYNDKTEEISFLQNTEKLKTELVLEKFENTYYEYTQHKYFFKMNEKYGISATNKGDKFFYGQKHIIRISPLGIEIHQMPEHLTKLISRIELNKNYYYGYKTDYLQTRLEEEEIINLNNIIADGKKYLDLKTEPEPNYNIKKFDETKSVVEVDFDFENSSLEIKAITDYGFCSHNVSETVFYSKSQSGNSFKRRNYKDQKNYVIEINGQNIFYAPLDAKQEIDLFKSFYNKPKTGFSKTVRCKIKGKNKIYEFWQKHWPEIKKTADKKGYEIKFIKDNFEFCGGDFRADFDVDFNAENDWLAFDVKCYCGDDKISLKDLKKYAINREEFVKTKDGRLLRITNFEQLERFILMLESFYQKENERFEGKIYHAPELEDIFTSSDYYNAKLSKDFSRFIKEAKAGKPVEKVKKPANFNKVLRSYQKDGVDWFYFLRKYRFAGILADDMGTGKTLQALTLISMNRAKEKPSLVLCPKSLIYNWQNEARKFTPHLETIVIDGLPKERPAKIRKVKNFDLVITSYPMMKKDEEFYKKQKIKFNYCLLDEAQYIKNHKTKNAQTVKKIDADYRLALTGTPLENSVSEIWSIFDFLMPGFLGSNNHFIKKFQTPIMKNNSAESLRQLQKKVECFMLRRTKNKILKELPPKIEQISHCRLTDSQNILYQEILANVKSEIFNTVKEQGFAKSQIHILAGLTKLRQVCNHPVLLLKDKNHRKYESAKLETFFELINEIISSNRKVLVFSQFTMMLDILAEELKREKIDYAYLSGKTQKRQEMINDFNNNPEKKIFLISLKAGGTGLNLTSADNVIIFDPWWNPSVENQAIDRTHRIGQKNSVNVYRLITKGTIEEKIIALQERKKFLFNNLVGESNDLFKKLTWDDVKGLFQ